MNAMTVVGLGSVLVLFFSIVMLFACFVRASRHAEYWRGRYFDEMRSNRILTDQLADREQEIRELRRG